MFIKNLNKNQKKAVTNVAKYCLIDGVAGSGKTTVLASKTGYLIDELKVPPEEIVILTHSNKVAEKIKSCLMYSARNILHVGTIQSLAFKLLRGSYGFESPTILTPEEEGEIALDLVQKDNLKFRFKTEVVRRIEAERKGFFKWGDMDKEDDIRKLMLELYYEKTRNNIFNHDDLLREVCYYLSYRPLNLKYLLIDDFQEVSPIQYEFIKALISPNTNVFAVCDPNEKTYRVNGYEQGIISDFIQIYNPERLSLNQNYRSTDNIMKVAQTFKSNQGKVITSNEAGDKVIVKAHKDPIQESLYIADKIKIMVADGRANYSDIAILFRTQKQREVLEETFKRTGIPFYTSGKRSLMDIPCLNWLYQLLKVCVNPSDHIAAMKMLTNDAYGDKLSVKEAQKIIDNIKKYAKKSFFLDKAMEFKNWSKGKSARDIYDYLRLDCCLDYIYTGYSRYTDDYNRELIYRFLNKVDKYCKDNNLNLFEGLTELIALVALEGAEFLEVKEDTYENSVKLMTLHESKGLGFKQVFIIGINSSLISLIRHNNPNPLDQNEEKELLYVGITRAEEHLELSYYTCPSEATFILGLVFIGKIPNKYYCLDAKCSLKEEYEKVA